MLPPARGMGRIGCITPEVVLHPHVSLRWDGAHQLPQRIKVRFRLIGMIDKWLREGAPRS
eukprot:4167243-Karenia_brevis.AAC.1